MKGGRERERGRERKGKIAALCFKPRRGQLGKGRKWGKVQERVHELEEASRNAVFNVICMIMICN